MLESSSSSFCVLPPQPSRSLLVQILGVATMKSALFLAVAALNGALALPSLAKKDDPFSNWQAAGPDDARAPCPMLNSLANRKDELPLYS